MRDGTTLGRVEECVLSDDAPGSRAVSYSGKADEKET